MIEEVLRAILPILERLEIPYLLTGGIAATVHGRPRFTQDIDIVIAPTETQLSQLIDALDAAFVVDRDAAWDAYARHGEFNAIHRALVFKVDFWYATGSVFDCSRLRRAQSIQVAPGLTAKVATPEDAIISKLLWLKHGATERSLGDIRGILRAHPGQLDLAYLEGLIRQEGLETLWAPLRPEP